MTSSQTIKVEVGTGSCSDWVKHGLASIKVATASGSETLSFSRTNDRKKQKTWALVREIFLNVNPSLTSLKYYLCILCNLRPGILSHVFFLRNNVVVIPWAELKLAINLLSGLITRSYLFAINRSTSEFLALNQRHSLRGNHMFKKSKPFPAFLALVGLLFVAATVFAQSQATTGNIEGRVVDPNGAAVPSLTITATNQETGLTKTANTDEEGIYRILFLPPGRYRVTTSAAQGFAGADFGNVAVTVGGKTPLDIELK